MSHEDEGVKRHGVTIILLAVVVLLGFWTTRQNDARTRQGEQAHAALCVFREGLDGDIRRNTRALREAKRFIAKHPQGALGYTQAQLRELNKKDEADLAAQKKRRAALSAPTLTCP